MKKGFTLIELLVVIAIIGILASIIAVSLTSARAKGRDAKRIADVRTLQLALEEYYNDNGAYPVNLSTLVGVYLPNLPLNPGDNSTQYQYYALGPVYPQPSGGTASCNAMYGVALAYHLGVGLEDSTNGALLQDANKPEVWNIGSLVLAKCSSSSSPSFNGNAATAPLLGSPNVQKCVSGANVSGLGVVSQCYDVTN